MLIRVWNKIDIKDVEQHLLVVGDLYGDCSSCKELGLDWTTVTDCSHCKTHFKYIALRSSKPHERLSEVQRIMTKRPDLMFVDYHDYQTMIGKDKAHRFFGD